MDEATKKWLECKEMSGKVKTLDRINFERKMLGLSPLDELPSGPHWKRFGDGVTWVEKTPPLEAKDAE